MKRIYELIKRHEGLRLSPYRDSTGHWTIGYGTKLECPIPSITEVFAHTLMERDVAHAGERCEVFIHGWRDLSEVRQAVLIDMAYNLGIGGLLGFRRMLAAIERGRWLEAGREMEDSRWWGQVKGRAVELRQMMERDQWPSWLNALMLKEDDNG